MRVLLVLLILALSNVIVATSASAQSRAGNGAEDAPIVDITLTIDPSSGRIAAQSVASPAGEAVVVRPAGAWLGIDRLTFKGKEQDRPADGMGMRLRAGTEGQIEMTASGRLPDITHRFGAAGFSPEGGYLLGQAGWVPEVETTATYRLNVQVAAPWRVAVTGRVLHDEVDDDGVQRVTAIFDNALEPPSVFFGPYEVASRKIGELTVRTYFPPDLTALSDTYLEAAAQYVERYDTEIGAYPYGQFSIVAAPIPVGLGFAGLTYVGSQILPHPYMQGRSLAHEVLHSWLGNAVAVDYARGNWAEGMTAYLADHALAADAGNDVSLRGDWLTELSALSEERRRPVRAFRTAGHGQSQAVGYGKTALMFHMLRTEIGAPVFEAGLKAFWSDQQFELASWDDVQTAFERVSRRDLTGFFEQWLDRSDLPALRLERASVAGETVSLTLAQTQTGPVYDLLVPVRVDLDTGPVTELVRLDARSREVVLSFETAPRSVAIDPGFEVARALWPGERAKVMAEVFSAKSVDLEVATPAYAEAAETWRARALRRPGTDDDSGPRVVIGTRDDVLAARADAFSTPPAAQIANSASAAWVEADGEGRDWLFLSAPRPDVLAQDFARLRYYANRSYVLPNAGALETGVWTVRNSPMAARFN
ncbi:M1 family metallopeptidase [Tropicimonas sp. S265A]|uniref:M1 family metallopeptidase n=1 Tax=Tropicimonas sp. S265A TaxID=3415134 RepID=UPI003C799232